MSLFKARDWWSTWAGNGEDFDLGCLCVANIDNSPTPSDKIIIGSYYGILRIFMPRTAEFKPEDLMLEMRLTQPILQVEAGYFVSGSDELHLGVLHPRKFAVYGVSAISGAVEHGKHFTLKLVYQHILERTSYSFTYGPFGGVKGKDFVSILSMDGMLSFFEQETFAFGRFLPGFLLPSPVRYVAKTDAFVTCSSSRVVECYRYQTLASATDAETKENSEHKKVSGKRLTPDWTFNIGENAVNIVVGNFSNMSAIFVLGERAFYCLQCNGSLLFMKKFEYNPSCILPYASLKEETINLLVGTHNKTMMIYQNVTLAWAAQLPHIPVDVKMANFSSIKGIIVTLDETGYIYCSYLGTDPSLFVAPSSESRDLQYDEIENEMKELQKVIRESAANSELIVKPSEKDEITINAMVPTSLDEISCAVPDENGETFPSITVQLNLECHSNQLIENVMLAIDAGYPILCNKPSYVIPSIGDTTVSTVIEVSFYLCGSSIPSTMKVRAIATFTTMSDAPRISQCEFELPLCLVCRGCQPVKNAVCKLTLDTNKAPVNLGELFPEMVEDTPIPLVALGIEYYNGPAVTILASKTSQRYRIQCDKFEGLWLVVREMVTRLRSHFAKLEDGAPLRLSFMGPLPLQHYFDLIDNHFEQRLNQQKYREILGQRSSQFRVIQRRLLTKYKDKTPSPLANLDTLLDGTYRQLLALGEAEEDCQRSIQHAIVALSCGTRLFNLLIGLWTNMTDKEYRILEATLSADIVETESQGWEEVTDTAVTHLLKTCLSKSVKDQTVNSQSMQFPKDTSKLKKHIALLCDRLAKGSRLDLHSQPKDEPHGKKLESVEEENPDHPKSPTTMTNDKLAPITNPHQTSHPLGKLPELNSIKHSETTEAGGSLTKDFENMKPF